ncbi:MAG: chromosome segregation SMC family protein [Spirochaetota bacterium]
MFLKRIELFGFKSFADKSVIEFSQGISALLGPNGCGKSNVVDAVKWVLGEQATKSLRADRMEDIIFNGTDDRKPVNVAEVTLVMENADGRLPLEYTEVAVKRRLYRSGESEYYLNNQNVRLKEIRELFYDTGIGKSAYSIMEQGRIDQILSTRPEDRRHIFEEAAMITKYRQRGKDAERRLERTEENLKQIEQVISEVRRNHDPLQRQAAKAEQYRELRGHVFEVETNLSLLRLKGHLEEKHKLEEQIAGQTEKRDAIRTEIDGINASLDDHLDTVNEMESRLRSHQRRLYELEVERNNRQQQVRMLTERITELQDQNSANESRVAGLEERIHAADGEIEAQEGYLATSTDHLKDVEHRIAEHNQGIHDIAERVQENRSVLEEQRRIISSAEAEQEEKRGEVRELTDRIVIELDEGLKRSGYSSGERQEAESALDRELESLVRYVEKRLSSPTGGEAVQTPAYGEYLESTLREIQRRLTESTELFKRYRTAVPRFLDELVAPEGVITRKRALETDIDAAGRRIAQAKERITELQEQNKELGSRTEEHRKSLEELRVSKASLEARVEATRKEIRAVQERRAERRRDREHALNEIVETRKRIEGARERIKSLEEEDTALEEQEKQLKKELSHLETNIEKRNKDAAGNEKRLKERMDALGAAQTRLEQLNVKLAERNTEIRNVYTNYEERHSRRLDEFEARTYELRVDVKSQREELSKLQSKMKELGSVNLMAPEEFAEVKERYDFLSREMTDLRKARDDLRQVTEEIYRESTALFTQTYEKVKKNFHTMFRRLFGGGRAELRLTVPDDVLNSGIDILAQPPGKRLESIALLSGGERSLTAVALLFATYMVKPSPFCLLDEIDAALDESNVGRFVSMLQEFGSNSQFILITHNKKTVAGAKTLLGVTMEEPGVSKVVSVRLEQQEPVGA